MEKEGSSYTFEQEQVWRDTLDDSIIRFKDYISALPELSTDAAKKLPTDDPFALSEANCFKTLKSETSQDLRKGKLYYYPKEKKVFTVSDIKKDSNGSVVSANLNEKITGKSITIDSAEDLQSIRDTVNINLKFALSNGESPMVNAKVKLQNALEKELEEVVKSSIGKSISMFKLVHNGVIFDKSKYISSLEDVQDGIYFYAIVGFSTMHKFIRFRTDYYSPYWYSNATTPCALMYIPNDTVFICGFSVFAHRDGRPFELQYKIYVDDKVVEESDTQTITEYEDKYYYRVWLNDVHEVKPGGQLELYIVCAESISGNRSASTYYGYCGDSYKDLENEHKDLWTIKDSPKSRDTSLYNGQFPEIMYYM